MRCAPTLKIWMTPSASVAMLEKFPLLKIASCKALAFNKGVAHACSASLGRARRRASTASTASKHRSNTASRIATGRYSKFCMVQVRSGRRTGALALAHVRQQPCELLLDHAVAFAHMGLE